MIFMNDYFNIFKRQALPMLAVLRRLNFQRSVSTVSTCNTQYFHISRILYKHRYKLFLFIFFVLYIISIIFHEYFILLLLYLLFLLLHNYFVYVTLYMYRTIYLCTMYIFSCFQRIISLIFIVFIYFQYDFIHISDVFFMFNTYFHLQKIYFIIKTSSKVINFSHTLSHKVFDLIVFDLHIFISFISRLLTICMRLLICIYIFLFQFLYELYMYDFIGISIKTRSFKFEINYWGVIFTLHLLFAMACSFLIRIYSLYLPFFYFLSPFNFFSLCDVLLCSFITSKLFYFTVHDFILRFSSKNRSAFVLYLILTFLVYLNFIFEMFSSTGKFSLYQCGNNKHHEHTNTHTHPHTHSHNHGHIHPPTYSHPHLYTPTQDCTYSHTHDNAHPHQHTYTHNTHDPHTHTYSGTQQQCNINVVTSHGHTPRYTIRYVDDTPVSVSLASVFHSASSSLKSTLSTLKSVVTGNTACRTPSWVYDIIRPYIGDDVRVIFDPYLSPSVDTRTNYWSHKGFRIVGPSSHTPVPSASEYDLLVCSLAGVKTGLTKLFDSFSTVERFCILAPISVLSEPRFLSQNIQLIFITRSISLSDSDTRRSRQRFVWLCKGMSLPRDVMYSFQQDNPLTSTVADVKDVPSTVESCVVNDTTPTPAKLITLPIYFGGVSFDATLDTGAQLSLIRGSVAKTISRLSTKPIPTPIALKGLGRGHSTPTMMCVNKFSFAPFDARMYEHPLLIIDNNEIPEILLGLDFMKHFNIAIDCASGRVRFESHDECVINTVSASSDSDFDINQVPDTTSVDTHTWPKLSDQHKKYLMSLLNKYTDIFMNTMKESSISNVTEHNIDLVPGSKPVHSAPYRRNPKMRQLIDTVIQDMLLKGVISPCQSDWASPVLLVNKKDGTMKIAVNYKKLNEVTVKDRYGMARVDDCLDILSKAKYFTTLDLASGYYQIKLADRDRHLTAFVTHNGLYQYNTMPYGLCNAPATIQRSMNKMLSGLLYRNCICYVDDIIIFSDTYEQHMKDVQEVFERVRSANMLLKGPKCFFAYDQLEFLGYIVSGEGVRLSTDKIKAMRDMVRPDSVHGIQSFLGLVNAYKRFIPNLSRLAKPLIDLLKKDAKFVWSDKCEKSFEELKENFISAPIMAHPDFTRPFVIRSDACNHGLGACLLQYDADNIPHPIAYISRKVNDRESLGYT